jgi:hypothetical protein
MNPMASGPSFGLGVSANLLDGLGRISVQSHRTDSGTADGTRLTAPWLDSRLPTTTGPTHEKTQAWSRQQRLLRSSCPTTDVRKGSTPHLLLSRARERLPLIVANRLRLLATFGEIEIRGTSMRGVEGLSLSNSAVFPPSRGTGKRGETSKRSRFTKIDTTLKIIAYAVAGPNSRLTR